MKMKTAVYKSKDYPEPEHQIVVILPSFMESPPHIVIRDTLDDYSETKYWHKGNIY